MCSFILFFLVETCIGSSSSVAEVHNVWKKMNETTATTHY